MTSKKPSAAQIKVLAYTAWMQSDRTQPEPDRGFSSNSHNACIKLGYILVVNGKYLLSETGRAALVA